ncbi:MAG: cadherin domain-containing protein, partial [Chloroflexi bacterium]|nr:cadherin domain-containing protein [Chloroflexota bacterium]
MISGFRQFTQVIANPAVGVLLLAMAGVISGTTLDIVPVEAVLAQPLNARQSLAIEGPTAVEFPENSTAAIATYRVLNAASDSIISWSIDGTDARRLSIDDSGVLRFKAAKNFERPNDGNRDNEYEVGLSVTDQLTHASVEVVVTIADVNEPPSFELESAEFSVEENASANRRVGGALVVTDPDEGDSRTFSVEGEDADLFHIDDEGQIRVRPGAVLDYETLGILSLTALVTDQGGLSDSLPVDIRLTDADDPGVVTFSRTNPFIGVLFLATVSDDDGVTGRIRWRWYRAMNANDEFERIDGATRNSYTPVEDDEGYILRSTVSYEDNFEVGATASEISAAVGRNAPPEFGSASITLTVLEEASAGTDVGDSVTATDSDGDDLSYTLSGEDPSYFEINALTGQISVGAQALPDSETKDSYSVIVTATDEAGATGSVTVLISVAPPDVEPSIIGPATASYTENGTGVIATYSVADLDSDNVTWSVAGTDAARFSISDSGELSFNSAPDYENPQDANSDNVYEVTVTASDGNLESTLDVEVTVSNVNEAILVTGPATVSYAENGTVSVATYTATDPEGDEITWGIAGTDMSRFSIKETGELSFNSPPDYEKPRDGNKNNVYEVTVTASDGNLESTLDVEVTVTDVNEAAVIAGPTSVSYTENGTVSVATYTATDPEGDEFTLDIAGTDMAQFMIDMAGVLSFNSPPDYENPRDANNDNVYEVTVTASDGKLESTLDVKVTVTDFAEAILITGPATIDYAENGTVSVATYMAGDPDRDGITWGIAGADALRFAIGVTGGLSFNSPQDYEKPRDANKDNVYEVTVVASDDNLESTLDVEVTVQDVNEAILITGPASFSYAENSTTSLAIYTAADPDGDEITWGVAGADMSRFLIKETGELSFNSPPDYEKPRDANKDNVFEVTITASDGNLTTELDVEVTVTDINEAASITGPATVSHTENTVENVATYSATDPEGDEITWGVAGADMSRFSIKEAGELSFHSPPDYA